MLSRISQGILFASMVAFLALAVASYWIDGISTNKLAWLPVSILSFLLF